VGSSDKDLHWLGFDLGGTKMQATVFNEKFKVAGAARIKTKDYKGVESGVRGITETIERALHDAGLEHKRLGGIGVGCPGVLDLDKGVIMQAPNLGWRNVALAKILEKEFGCPAVLANDVDAGTFGEYRFGAGKGARCLVGVFPGTGIGGGCVYEGHLLRGRVSSCMEIGHMHMQAKGRLCGCGRRGCLETVSSRLAISAEAAAAAFRGDAPHLLELAGTDLTKIRSRTLAQAIKAGDSAIEDIVRHAAKPLGVAIASVVNLLAPDVVVLGGGLIEAMADYFLDEVRDAIEKQAMKPFRKSVKVAAAELGDDAVAMGAAALAAEFADDHK
jgi:glucokinase